MRSKKLSQGKTEARPPDPVAREQFFEVLVFLFLIVPSMVLALFVFRAGTLGFVFTAFAVILRDLSLVSLILFFLWRNGEPRDRLGWNFKNGSKDVILGVGLFIPMFFGAGILEHLLQTAGFSAPATPQPAFLAAKGGPEIILAAILVVVVAVAEETIFRGYLLLRFQGLMMGPAWAALLSAFIFSLGHGYEGSSGVVTVGAMGFVFALVYLWRGSRSHSDALPPGFHRDCPGALTGFEIMPWLKA